MSLGDEGKSENNTPFSIQICRGYNNVANTFRLAAMRTVFTAKVGAHMRIQYSHLYQSIAQVKTIHPSAYKYATGITMLQIPLGYLL